jgi:hypothetical protein
MRQITRAMEGANRDRASKHDDARFETKARDNVLGGRNQAVAA